MFGIVIVEDYVGRPISDDVNRHREALPAWILNLVNVYQQIVLAVDLCRVPPPKVLGTVLAVDPLLEEPS